VLGDEARRVLVDQAGAGVLGVAHVRLDAVVTAQHAHDAALGPGGGAFVSSRLASTTTGGLAASSSATVRPARPAPITTTGARA
jgi:hypothetical protein